MNQVKQNMPRGIRLSVDNGRVMVAPNDGHWKPFPLPLFPSSQSAWITHLMDLFHRQHGRCMAVSLMLDNQRWLRPQIPTQSCAEDGVSWSYCPEDYADRPANIFIGGSYQTAVIHNVDEVLSRIPSHDGLHMLSAINANPGVMYAVLTIGGEKQFAIPEAFMVDDWTHTLASHMDRLILG